MAIVADATNLVFTAKGDTSSAREEFKKFRDELKQINKDAKDTATPLEAMGHAAGLTASQFSTLSTGISALTGVVTGLVAGLAAAAVTTGAALFSLARSASDFGSVIHDTSEKTGLSATTISSLKVAADQSGSSLEELSKGVTKFTLLMGDAAKGNEKAQATLKSLHVTSTDLDTGFAQVVKTISELKPGIEQNTAAADAFGKRMGAELIPVINSFNGDLPALIERVKELGATISEKDSRAADEFGDVMDDLNLQLKSVGRTIGFAVMPEFTRFAKTVSGWLANNKGEVKNWATATEEALSGLIGYWNDLANAIERQQKLASQQPGQTGHNLAVNEYNPKFDLFRTLRERGRERLLTLPADAEIGGKLSSSSLGDDDDAKKAADDARKQQIAGNLAYLNALDASNRDHIIKSQQLWEEAYKRREVTDDQFHDAVLENERRYRVTSIENINQEYASKLSAEKLNGKQRAALKLQQQNEIEKLISDSQKREEAADKFLADQKNEQIKTLTDKLNREVELQEAANQTILARNQANVQAGLLSETVAADKKGELDLKVLNMKLSNLQAELNARKKAGQDTADLENKIAVLKEQIAQREITLSGEIVEAIKKEGQAYADKVQKMEEERQKLEDIRHEQELNRVIKPGEPGSNTGDDTETDPISEHLDRLADKWDEVKDRMGQAGAGIKATFADIGSVGLDFVNGMINALGDAIEGWVLYGDSIGKALKKALAAELAHVAAEAAIRAIYATAWGLLMLATFNFDAAGKAFASAALWAGLAVSAGLAGRAVAGNSFKQNSSGAYGSSGSTAQSRSSGASGGGTQGAGYSGFGDDVAIIDSRASAPTVRPGEVIITFKEKSDWFSQMFKTEVERNGPVRQIIRDTAG